MSQAPRVDSDNEVTARKGSSTQVAMGAVGPAGEAGLSLGTGTDTHLYKAGTGVLASDGVFWGLGGVALSTKAGTPSDADFTAAQLHVGLIVIDTSTPKIWVRTATATWVGVAVA